MVTYGSLDGGMVSTLARNAKDVDLILVPGTIFPVCHRTHDITNKNMKCWSSFTSHVTTQGSTVLFGCKQTCAVTPDTSNSVCAQFTGSDVEKKEPFLSSMKPGLYS